MTIRAKVTLLATVSVALSLAITTAATLSFVANSTRSQTLQSAQLGLDQAETSLGIFFSDQAQLLNSLATDPALWKDAAKWSSYAATKAETKLDPTKYNAAEAVVATRFQLLASSFDHILQIEAGTTGSRYVMAPPGTKPAGYDPLKRPWYLAAVPGKVVTTGVRVTSDGVLAVSYVVPFTSPSDSGVVSLSVSLKDLSAIAAQLKIGSRGFVMLFQGDGTVLASPKDSTLVGKVIGKDKLTAFTGFDLTKTGQTTATWQDRNWDVLIRPSPSTGYWFAAFLDPQEYLDLVTAILMVAVVLAVLVLLLSILVASVLAARISRPLKIVAGRLKEIAEGEADLTVVLNSVGRDEVGDLTRHFNTFLARLESLVHSLKSRAGILLSSSDTLSAALEENGASIHEVTQSVRIVANRLEEERRMVGVATVKVRQVVEGLDRIEIGTNESHQAI